MICIFLTGYMGARKATLGKAPVRELYIPFIDPDWYTEKRFHKAVGGLFTERGESGSRGPEKSILHEADEFEDVAIPTGEGAPCFSDNMEYMNQVGTAVLLNVDPKVLSRRLRVVKQQRPILQEKEDDELFDFIIQTLEKRSSFHRQTEYIFCADELEDCKQVETSVEQLRKLLDLHVVG